MSNYTTISDLAKDLISKIGALTPYGGRVAATLGGTESDPTLANQTPPFAWVVFHSSQNTGKQGQRWVEMRFNFQVVIALPYSQGESDFLDNQIKLLEDTAQAVSGTPNKLGSSSLWIEDGWTLISIDPERVHYQLNFSTVGFSARQLSS